MPSAKDNGFSQGMIGSEVGWKMFCSKSRDVRSQAGRFFVGMDAHSKNPQSMDGMFFAGMDVPARDKWFPPEISLGQGGWMRVRGMGCFPWRMFSSQG